MDAAIALARVNARPYLARSSHGDEIFIIHAAEEWP